MKLSLREYNEDDKEMTPAYIVGHSVYKAKEIGTVDNKCEWCDLANNGCWFALQAKDIEPCRAVRSEKNIVFECISDEGKHSQE